MVETTNKILLREALINSKDRRSSKFASNP